MATVISSGLLSEGHTQPRGIKESQNAPKCWIVTDGCFSTNKKYFLHRTDIEAGQ